MIAPRAARDVRNPALDGLRGVAILLVVLDHGGVSALRGAGGVGVTLFFVLSGYLITGSLVAEHARAGRIDLRHFYLRRARRLMPALLVMLVVTMVWWRGQGLPTALITLVYLANVPASDPSATLFGPLHHMWSLAVEEQFYVVWPAVLVVLLPRLGRSRVVAVALLTAVALVVRGAGYDVQGFAWAYHGTLPNLFPLLAGALLAVAPNQRLEVLTASNRVWRDAVGALAISSLALLAVLPIGGNDWMMLRTILTVPVALLLVPRADRWMRAAPLRYCGRVSYGWYLWHVFFQVQLGGLIGAAVSFVVAIASWHLLEQRVIRASRARHRSAGSVPPLLLPAAPRVAPGTA